MSSTIDVDFATLARGIRERSLPLSVRCSNSKFTSRSYVLYTPEIDRPGIYAALRVPELWRFDGEREQVIIERLGNDGSYHSVDESRFLPIRAEEIRRWVVDENSDDESAWAERLHGWARAELLPRVPR